MCFESQWFGCGAATSRISPPTVARSLALSGAPLGDPQDLDLRCDDVVRCSPLVHTDKLCLPHGYACGGRSVSAET